LTTVAASGVEWVVEQFGSGASAVTMARAELPRRPEPGGAHSAGPESPAPVTTLRIDAFCAPGLTVTR